MTNIDLEKIFKSDDFKTCEDELKKSEIRSYRNSDPEPEIKVNREKMNELKEKRNFTQFNFPKIDKYKELPNANNWEKFIAKYELNTKKYNQLFSGNSEKLLDAFNNFYNAHPFLTPFVGENYGKVLDKEFPVLFVMESHYLPNFSEFYPENINKMKRYDKQNWLLNHWYVSDWYKNTLYREDLEYMWTESVIKYNMISNKRFTQLFNRMLSPLYSCIRNNNEPIPDNKIEMIPNNELIKMLNGIAFMNYYLRPAEKTGSHIMPTTLDNLISYINLLSVWEKLDKPRVIICSSLAADCFEAYAQCMTNKDWFKDYFVRCNHPSALSWFKEIKEDKTNVWFNSKAGKQTSYEIQKESYMSCPDFQINKNQ